MTIQQHALKGFMHMKSNSCMDFSLLDNIQNKRPLCLQRDLLEINIASLSYEILMLHCTWRAIARHSSSQPMMMTHSVIFHEFFIHFPKLNMNQISYNTEKPLNLLRLVNDEINLDVPVVAGMPRSEHGVSLWLNPGNTSHK